MGHVAYEPMVRLQEARHRDVVAGKAKDALFLLEHPDVITLGKNSSEKHVLRSAEELEDAGFDFFHSSRGGDVTYHGPGQLVAYPIIRLRDDEKDIRKFVYNLEEILIRTCADFNITAEQVEGLRGIWVGENKIAALGVRIARWTTMHGVALNVHTELTKFSSIVPCGIEQRGVTSMEKLLGRAPSMEEVKSCLANHAGNILVREIEVGGVPEEMQMTLEGTEQA
ncbi:MAG: lipoyl(octanoyl) transferase [Myxococcales bacterium]|nr:lipoyl(octanoyl) transferase [Myxococcales bacterium]